VDRLAVLLPFEVDYFRNRGIDAVRHGHPLLGDYPAEACEQALRAREQRFKDPSQPLRIGLLPGSRAQEIRLLLPMFLEAVAQLRAQLPQRRIDVVISRAPGADKTVAGLAADQDIEVTQAPLHQLLSTLDLCLVCSGTASLEVALAGIPHLVAYRASGFNYRLAKMLVKTEYIGLTNLILDRSVVKEFIQEQLTATAMVDDLLGWTGSATRRARLSDDVKALRGTLGDGHFWSRLAEDISKFLADRPST
jgi:lipid-A-disaccharide synthase